jgi:hypothetical protein
MQDSLPAGGLRLYREGVDPSGSLRKVSGYIALLLSRISPDARVVYAKPPFGGSTRVLAYLARYTHRAAIANSRLVAVSDDQVAFHYKDYRRGGRRQITRLAPHEFIRRFLLHVPPDGFHRIRHYGFLAEGDRGDGSNASALSSPRDRATGRTTIRAKTRPRRLPPARTLRRPMAPSPPARSAAASCAASAASRPSAPIRFAATRHENNRRSAPHFRRRHYPPRHSASGAGSRCATTLLHADLDLDQPLAPTDMIAQPASASRLRRPSTSPRQRPILHRSAPLRRAAALSP